MQEKGQREIEEGKGGGEFRIREKQREEGAKGTLRETGPLAYMGIVEQKPPHTLPAPPANKEPVAHSWDPLSVPEGEGILPPLGVIISQRHKGASSTHRDTRFHTHTWESSSRSLRTRFQHRLRTKSLLPTVGTH